MRKFTSFGPALVVLICVLVALFVVPSLIERYAYAQQSARISLARAVLAQDDILRSIDRATASIADIVEPSVVHIEMRMVSDEQKPTGSFSTGAGWVYDEQGHIVTNAHVVQSARFVSIEFYDGRVVRGRVIGMDPYTDIAVIQAEPGTAVFPSRRAEHRLPRTGDRVYAFGSPFGFKFSMSEGIISGLGREAAGSNVVGGYTNYIQTDAAVNPGNSGGPIVNTDAHVIGMNVAIATARSVGQAPEESGADSAGISFAIPLGTIDPIVNQIIKHGKVERGFLGIRYNDDQRDRDTVLTIDGTPMTGIQITAVEQGGPGQTAGLEQGDIIVKIQGSPVINAESLSSLVSSSRPGEQIDVTVYRDNRLIDIRVTLGKMRDEVLARRIAEPIMVQLGMSLREEGRRVAVQTVWTGFPADRAGFKQGDIIELVNAKRYDDYFSFFVLIADQGILTGKPIEFTVTGTDGITRKITLHLEW